MIFPDISLHYFCQNKLSNGGRGVQNNMGKKMVTGRYSLRHWLSDEHSNASVAPQKPSTFLMSKSLILSKVAYKLRGGFPRYMNTIHNVPISWLGY